MKLFHVIEVISVHVLVAEFEFLLCRIRSEIFTGLYIYSLIT